MNLHIRPAVPGDIPALLGIERASSSAAHWGEPEYRHIFDAGSVPRILLVAEEEKLLGFIMVRTVGPEWEIENVAVSPVARRRGIGAMLVADVLRQAGFRRAHAVLLEVRASNQAARSLYRRAGFAESSTRRGYYANPVEDAVLYRFDVAP